MPCLLDASVLVAAFSRESTTEKALSLMSREPQLAVHEFGLTETRIALIRKGKRREMTIEEVQRALDGLTHAVESGWMALIPQPAGIWNEAVRMAQHVEVHLRTADAVHAAWAKLTACGLATFDVDLAAAARAEGIATLS